MSSVWHVTIPAIALVRAGTASDAEAVACAALEAAGFTPYDDETRMIFESEPVPASHEFTPHRCPPTID